MKLEERHILEKQAIALEELAAHSDRRVSFGMGGWNIKTARAFRKAAKVIRDRLKEEN